MSKKVYGIPVATPINPDEIVPKGIVKTVNDVAPDESGNVVIDVSGEVNDALADAKENGEFNGKDGTPGKTAYQYALDGGYAGTEGEFAEKLAQEYPTKVSQLQNDSGYITSQDIPASSGSGIHIGTEPPEDENVTVWIDTDEEPEASGVDVTAEVGQTIVVEEVDANGKPTKWKAMDFQPRTHWVEPVELVNGTAVLNADAGVLILPTNIQFTAGQTYHVTYNGTEYTCTAVFHEMVGYVIGNLAMAGLPDTGEPFCMMTQEGALGIMDFNGVTEATVKILGESVHKLPSKFIPTQDWNANDGDPGHVLNRTHYSTYENITLLDNQLVESLEFIDFKLVEGQTYHVVCDGAEFDNVAKSIDFNGMSLVIIGNDVFLGGDDTGDPYACAYMDGVGTQIMFDAESVTLSISTVQEVVHKLPEKYLPETTPFVIRVYTTNWADYTVLATVAKVEEAFAAGRLLFVDIAVGSGEITMNFRLNLIQYCNYVDLSPYGTTFYFSNGDTLAYQFTPQEDGGYAIKRTITEAV